MSFKNNKHPHQVNFEISQKLQQSSENNASHINNINIESSHNSSPQQQNSPNNSINNAQLQSKKFTSKNEKMTQDFWFSNQLYNRPGTILFFLITIVLVMISVVFIGGFFKLNENTFRDYYLWDNEKVKRSDATELARDEYEKQLEKDNIPFERSVPQDEYQIFLVYKLKKKSKQKTLMTEKNLKLMQKIEKHLTTFDNNQFQQVCLSNYQHQDLSCAQPYSVPLIIKNSTNYDTLITQQKIDLYIETITQNEILLQQNKFFYDNEFSPKNKNVQIARSIYKIGFPLRGFTSTIDQEKDQKDIVKKWNEELYNYIAKDQSNSDMEVMVFSEKMVIDYTEYQLNKDIVFATMSFGFVTLYMMIHTRSIAIGLFGCFIIGITTPVSYFIYRIILQFRYFTSLHTSTLFVLLGVGADDLFVFYDSFQQAEKVKEVQGDLKKRIAFSYRRASMAMLVTSLTTIFAFLATAISPLMPIMSFGVYSAINILVDYLLTISLLPAFIVLREKRSLKQLLKKSNQKQQQKQKQQLPQEQLDTEINEILNKQNKNQLHEQQYQGKEQEKEQELSRCQLFFQNKWNIIIFKARYLIVFLFLILFGFKIYGTLQLEGPKEPPTRLKDDHFMQRAQEAVRNDFPFAQSDPNSIEINLAWGLKDVDRSNTDYFDPQDLGSLKYDQNFDLSPQTNQQFLYDICTQVLPNQKDLVSETPGNIECFMLEFQQFTQQINQTFPVPQQNFSQILQEFLKDDLSYNFRQQKQIGFINNQLKYIIISYSGNELAIQGRKELESLYDQYEALQKAINSLAPNGLNNSFQSSPSWPWMVSEKVIIQGAIKGIIISLSLAFIVLVLSTQNIILGFYAIFCIIAVVTGTLSVIYLRGWEFGTFQSINAIIIIGLSVDYVVHLVNQYQESENQKKYQRTQEMLTIMGVSVIGGGLTTLGAGLFLFGGQLLLLNIMGIMVCATIGFSLLWALIFLPALLHIIGPQNQTGNLKQIIQYFRNFKKQIQPQANKLQQKQ